MEGISGRRSARLSRGPRGTDLGGLRVLASIANTNREARGTKEATGMSEVGRSIDARKNQRRTFASDGSPK